MYNNYKQEQRIKRVLIDGEICHYPNCQKKSNQLAHRISQSKMFYQLYGSNTIEHNFNLVSVCCLEHNDYFNIGQNYTAEKKLIDLIENHGKEKLTVEEINDIIGFKK
jgi:hypothetical protein